MQKLIDYITQFVKLDDEAIQALKDLAEIEIYRKNQYILENGQRCNKIWFLKKGMVRKFHLCDGKEITTWIHTENETFTSLQSYAQDTPSDEFLQACEDTEVIGITKTNSEKLSRHPQFIVFTSTLMEREFVNIDKHTKALNQRDAKGKYEYLREIAPEIIKRAKIGHIASVIGVSRETLSRIRRSSFL
ncbi:Crp/Fnr family transcriptional regulator [Saccharicrinis sp. FJH2]|uniref:Crp/Fnr family transcriptional regulator n=1 Tax=Saccharicrinis sp. FJH65 TaxID=3344659 RepID=UPI0035F305A5